MEKLRSDLQRIMDRREEEQLIRCPFCKEVQSNDDCAYPVSYWGMEDGPQRWECQQCEKDFFVKELVERTYEEAKTEEEL